MEICWNHRKNPPEGEYSARFDGVYTNRPSSGLIVGGAGIVGLGGGRFGVEKFFLTLSSE